MTSTLHYWYDGPNNPAKDFRVNTYSPLGNPHLFTGRITDTPHASDASVSTDPDYRRTQDNRNRTYELKHSRWRQRDPMGYVDGASLYEYVRSNPLNRYDPNGFYVIAVGGAGGYGDGAVRSLADTLSQTEHNEYYRKCYKGCFAPRTMGDNCGAPTRYEFIGSPTGFWLGGVLFPNWSGALQRLDKAVREYNKYYFSVRLERLNGGCCRCPEYLHIIGFSDGATTVARWLEAGAPAASIGFRMRVAEDFVDTKKESPYGMVALLDVVRKGSIRECVLVQPEMENQPF